PQDEGGPGQDGQRPPAHRGGGPQPAPGAQRRRRDDPLRPGRFARGGAAEEDPPQVRRGAGDGAAEGALPRDGAGHGAGGVHAQEADGWPRPVRARGGDGGAAAAGQRPRIPEQDRGRGRAQAVRGVGGEGRRGGDAGGGTGPLPDGRHEGEAGGRQGASGGLLGNRVKDRGLSG